MMKPQLSAFSAIVVDDEPLPRAHLSQLLREAGVGTVHQAGSGTECRQLFDSEPSPPDWVFLDVQMRGMDGLALADAIGAGQISSTAPSIVFVTGYEEYAIQAFNRAAVDYLLKPVARERLAITLDRLAVRRAAVADLPEAIGTTLPMPKLLRLPIRLDYAVHLIDIADIVAATSRDKRVNVLTADAVYPTYYTLNQLEQRLPATDFLRVHESWIVRLADVLEIHHLGSQSYELRLRNVEHLVPVSRRRYPVLQNLLGL